VSLLQNAKKLKYHLCDITIQNDNKMPCYCRENRVMPI